MAKVVQQRLFVKVFSWNDQVERMNKTLQVEPIEPGWTIVPGTLAANVDRELNRVILSGVLEASAGSPAPAPSSPPQGDPLLDPETFREWDEERRKRLADSGQDPL